MKARVLAVVGPTASGKSALAIELAKRLSGEENIVIQIVGDGNVKEKFISEVEESGLKNIQFFPLQPIDIVPDVYSACSLCIIPLQKGVIGNGVPSKAPILMACNRVIVNSVETDSYYARIFKENNMGVAVDIFDYDGLADAVIDLYNSPEKMKAMAENAHKYGFIERYTAEKQSITGIIPEPWHWRFVGVEYAGKIKNSGLCLEEYLEKLQQILRDKLRSLKYSSEYEKKGKLFKFAQSRGFESNAISKIIDNL